MSRKDSCEIGVRCGRDNSPGCFCNFAKQKIDLLRLAVARNLGLYEYHRGHLTEQCIPQALP